MINNFVLAGRLTADPEMNESQGGTTVTKFRVACDRQFKKDGGQEADFFSCVAFGKTAEMVAQHFEKGAPIAVEGRVEIDQVEKEGRTNYYTNVVVNSVRFIETRAAAEARRGTESAVPRGRAVAAASQPVDVFGDQ